MTEGTSSVQAPTSLDAGNAADPASVPGKQFSPTAVSVAGKAHDLPALRDALVDAANVSARLWFSYLFALFYFLIAVGGVNHGDLFLESPIKLPSLNVDLPLFVFFRSVRSSSSSCTPMSSCILSCSQAKSATSIQNSGADH
jgi:hypothetical protein